MRMASKDQPKSNKKIPSFNNDFLNDEKVNEQEVEILEDDEEQSFIQWITRGNGLYYPEAQVKLVKKIPTGFYGIGLDQQAGKYTVRKLKYITDKIYKLPMPEMDMIINDITTFWAKEADFKRYGLTFKRGVLMYGAPGGGKSHIIQLIVKHLIEHEKGVVFKIESPNDVETFHSFMQSTFKKIEPNRRIVVIIEDIDGLFHAGKHTETILLNILDGMGQMDNVVYLATTNYPEELASRVINRPSRFDRRYEITLPNEAVRRSYFEQILKSEDFNRKDVIIDLDFWVEKTDGLSIAHLREIVASTVILGNTFDDTIRLMKEYNEKTPSSRNFTGSKKIGFGK
jgi:energy-coupling factor transporter ATP-binding protein EcfA2